MKFLCKKRVQCILILLLGRALLNHMKYSSIWILGICLLFASCKKEPEVVTFSGNEIPDYSEIPTLLVENYVNSLYIDLIGREPTDAEMNLDVAALESGSLDVASRTAIVNKLMTSTLFIEGDTSYAHAYSQKFYDDNKARFLDGISEGEVLEQYYLYYYISVQDSLNGNILAYELNRQQSDRVKDVIDSKSQMRLGQISNDEMCRRMCFNVIYDDLNMNTFNFINATFDDLFYRFPTEAELDEAFEPIEQVPSAEDPDLTAYLFGQIFSNKSEYLQVLTTSEEFSEGMIRWAYLGLLSREPTTIEVYNLLDIFNTGNNIKAVQKSILISDEYAGFE